MCISACLFIITVACNCLYLVQTIIRLLPICQGK
jgi:hypothetical protein